MLHFGVISLIPEILDGLQYWCSRKGYRARIGEIGLLESSRLGSRPYSQVDDKPYGGGPGMVMMYEPVHAAIKHARRQMPGQLQDDLFKSPGQSNLPKRLKSSGGRATDFVVYCRTI